MNATAQPIAYTKPAEKNWLAVYAELFKPRLTALVLLTTLAGFYLGMRGPLDYLLMLRSLLGTALLAGGASALSQPAFAAWPDGSGQNQIRKCE